jgi:hypothetical protein
MKLGLGHFFSPRALLITLTAYEELLTCLGGLHKVAEKAGL